MESQAYKEDIFYDYSLSEASVMKPCPIKSIELSELNCKLRKVESRVQG